MAQRRFVDFGSSVQANKINSILRALVQPGVLSGGDFGIRDSDTISISPVSVMLKDLLMIEDATTFVNISLTSAAKSYTILYEHTDRPVQGGVLAQLLIREGVFKFGELANSSILGWVLYPGGSVPLSLDFFVQAPKLQISNPSLFPTDFMLPPFNGRFYVRDERPDPGKITVTDIFDPDNTSSRAYLEFENTGAGIQTITHWYPFVARNNPPRRLVTEVSADLAASISFSLIAGTGSPGDVISPNPDVVFNVANGIISNTSGLFVFREMSVLALDESLFSPGSPYFIQTSVQLNPGKKLFVSFVGANENNLPF